MNKNISRLFFKQDGQSLVEFLVVMTILSPIFIAIYYMGKYADLKHSVVQASRYAAFQRVMQPDATRLSTQAIQDKLRARFFARGDSLSGNPEGEIRSADTATGVPPGSDVVLWRDMNRNPLLPSAERVTLAFEQQQVAPAVQASDSGMRATFNLPMQHVHVANVEVSLVDHLRSGDTALLIGASTAISSDAANAQGSQGVRAALNRHPVLGAAANGLDVVRPVIHLFVGIFERVTPELPCIRVESVPSDRLSGPGLPGACQ
jgi:hypothetical protein